MKYTIYPKDSGREAVGRKASALAELQRAAGPVPAWFALSPEAFYASISDRERRSLETAVDPSTVDPIIQKLAPSVEVQLELSRAVRWLCPNGERVAVRSSARDEDSVSHSFAGQLESFLFVRPEHVPSKVAEVWRSAFSERALSYRRERGLNLIPHPPAVLIQRMVHAEISGVAFGADPVTGRRGITVVSALYGLGTALVSGECDADTYHVDREGHVMRRIIASKRVAYRYDPDSPEGTRKIEVPEDKAKRPALHDDQIRAVAALTRRAGGLFSRPQDIEWAIENGHLYLLQSRPITSLYEINDPDGVLTLWDNSNITESYSGVTTPLTFSFARRAYEEVYRQFCLMMGVHASTIAAHRDTFRRMIGLIRGRVYYNLFSWYRMLALLPGFSTNRRFMEQMMGVKESLSDAVLTELGPASWHHRLKDSLNLLRTLSALTANHFLLPYRIKKFNLRLDLALAPTEIKLEELRADELARHYHDLERQLLTRWDAPITNDFFAMVFFGLLRRLTEKWCGDKSGTLQNRLLCGEDGMISAEPARRMREMARLAGRNRDFVALLCAGSVDRILDLMEEMPDFKCYYKDYLKKFGDRCLGELKLESPTLHDDPLPLLRSVGQLARQLGFAARQHKYAAEEQLRNKAEQQLNQILAGRPIKRLLLRWVLRNARAHVRDRENLRFGRTRLFGLARSIFTEIGKRFYALNLLEAPRDIFYLEVDEILGFIEGTSTSTNLKGLVAVRKTEFAAHAAAAAPDDRFETRGIVHHGNALRQTAKADEATDKNLWKGIGCSPGIVRGPVRVISDPRHADLHRGEILVAERTDPGWIMLFPSAAGLLVERGSLLSHSAIVAREMGIPAIVSLSGVTRRLKNGDWVELNGSSGVVRRVDPIQGVTRHAI